MSKKHIKIERDEDGFVKQAFKKVGDKFYDLSVLLHSKRKPAENNLRVSKYRQLIFYIGFMTIPLLQLLIFYFVVNANSILLAFQQYDIKTATFKWAGLANFKQLFYNLSLPGDPLIVGFKNSLILYGFSLIVGVSCALLFSYYIYKKQFASEFFRVILFLPQILSTIVMVVIFKHFTDSAIPAFAEKWFGAQVTGVLSQQSTRFGAIVFFNIWGSFGTNVLMYTSAMTRIPQEITEYASLDGVSPIREFFQITIPLIYSTITAFLVIGITNIFISQAALYEFFGGNRLPDESLYTIGFYLFRYVLNSEGFNNYAYASAAGIVATFIAAPLTLGLRALLEKFDPSTEA